MFPGLANVLKQGKNNVSWFAHLVKCSWDVMFPVLTTFGKDDWETMFPGLAIFGKHSWETFSDLPTFVKRG
jgi:hypothetical protein